VHPSVRRAVPQAASRHMGAGHSQDQNLGFSLVVDQGTCADTDVAFVGNTSRGIRLRGWGAAANTDLSPRPIHPKDEREAREARAGQLEAAPTAAPPGWTLLGSATMNDSRVSTVGHAPSRLDS
jgi:hypothetical protein